MNHEPVDPGPADPPTAPGGDRRRTVLLTALVVMTGLIGVYLSAIAGRADSALVFVGVPTLLALLVGMTRLRGAGAVFQVVTIVLLLSAALLHEGAICVLLASPIVYGAAFAAYGVARLVEPDPRQYAVVPVLLVLVALEGVTPGLRVDPRQHAGATQVVASTCDDFEQALARGPRFEADQRGRLLDTAGYPTPSSAAGSGLALGDTWSLATAGGEVTTRVTRSTSGAVDFEVVSDTSHTQRWVGLRGGELRWEQTAAGCRAEVGIDYERRLDPGLWFGPVSAVFMDAGARVLLRSLT